MNRGDSWCHIPNYVKHTVVDTEKGVNIKIYDNEGNVREFKCDDVTRNKESWIESYKKWKQ
tara:strand:+ start:316 stop:498 length:183 start_codon:yes stop_codon:yes gene_type:complete